MEKIKEFNLDTDDIKLLHSHDGRVIGKEKECYVLGSNEGGFYIVTAIISSGGVISGASVRFNKAVSGSYGLFMCNNNPLQIFYGGDQYREGSWHLPRCHNGNGMYYFDTIEDLISNLKSYYENKKTELEKRISVIDKNISDLSVEKISSINLNV